MINAAIINQTLEHVVDLHGDPNERVYARLFELYPEYEDLFSMDQDGGVRASMLYTSINCVLGVAEGSDTPKLLLEAARMSHDGYGMRSEDLDKMFVVMRDVFRDILGAGWTPEMEIEWSALLRELALIC